MHTLSIGNNNRIGYNEQEPPSLLHPNHNDQGYNQTGEGCNADMGPSCTQVFAQELGNTNLVEYHKEPRPLTTESSKGAGSSPIKATKQSPNGSNSTTYSDHIGHNTVKIQNVLPS